MRKLFTLLFLLAIFSGAYGQTSDNKWALGFLVGKTEYQGDLGSGILKCKPFYGSGAISLNRYLNSSFDLILLVELGNIGFENKTASFNSRKTDGSVLLKYKFNNGYILPEDAKIAPFLAAGPGLAKFKGSNTVERELDAILPVGGGIKVNVTPEVALQYQFLYYFTNGDNRDLITKGVDDKFALHAIGAIINLGSKK